MSMLTSGRFSVQVEPTVTTRSDDDYTPNPCSFYLLNLAIDTTLGIPILIILLRVTTGLVGYTSFGKPLESIQSGNYGNPPNAWWWLKQSVIYFFGLFGMKICVLIIFLMMPWISKVGDWALGWTEGNERLQIAFVMMIFPLIMNGLQYYIIDSFIKKKDNDHERLPSDDPDEVSRRRRYDDGEEQAPLRQGDVDSDLLDSDDEEVAKLPPRPQSKDTEYDPDVDGDDDRTIIGSSQSGHNEQGKIPPPELFPKE
ncbi:Fc.00g062590.m01.CDS01 [Cosmosporella sp. VM-42]